MRSGIFHALVMTASVGRGDCTIKLATALRAGAASLSYLAVVAVMLLLFVASPPAMASSFGDDPPDPDCPNSSLTESKDCKSPPKTLETINVHAYPVFFGGLPFFGSGVGFGGGYSPNNHTPTTDKEKQKGKCQATASDPVEVGSGTKLLNIPLFVKPGEMGLRYVLYYRSVTGSALGLQMPWTSSISFRLVLYCGNPMEPCNEVSLYRPDGSSISFSGNHTSFGNFAEIGGGGLVKLTHNANDTWTLHDEDTTVQTYDSYGRLTSVKDASGIGWNINSTVATSTDVAPTLGLPPGDACIPAFPGDPNCPDPPPQAVTTTTTTVVTHTDGQSFTVVRIAHTLGQGEFGSVTVTDPAGNQYNYSWKFYRVTVGSGSAARVYTGNEVTSLTFPGSPTTTMTFNYTSGNQLLSGAAYNGNPYWITSYDASNRVINDGAADGSETTSIAYATTANGLVATITNPLGLTTTNTYTIDSQGYYLLSSVSNTAVQGCGATTNSFTWDANDHPTKTVDNNGITHTYSYAVNGQLQSETEASGTSIARTTSYAWDPNQQLNRLLSVTVAGEKKTSFAYDSHNRPASVTLTNLTSVGTPNQTLKTTYTYVLYANGMVKTMTVTAPSPGSTDKLTYQYDAHGNVTSVADGLGHATAYSGYNALGEPGHITGPNGDVTDYTWDARGRVIHKTMHPNGVAATWTYAYDGYGALAKITAPDGEITTWTRNAELRVTSISHNDKDGTSTETFGYDANGDVISDVIKRGTDVGKSTTYIYNALGEVYQIKGSHGQKLTYAYDGSGNVLSVTDALSHVTTYAYDGLNRVEGSMDAAGGVTIFDYDKDDHVAKVIDPRGLVTTYSYDGLGQLWKQVSPDTGTTTFVHDQYGRLTSKTRNSGNHIAYAYDALNRVTGVAATNSLGTVTRSFTYDTCTHGIGRLCTATHVNDDTVSYSYTPQGQIAQRSFSFVAGVAYNLGYTYDNMGQLASVTYPDGNQALYDYTRGAVADVRLRIGSASSYAATSVVYRPMDLALSGWTSNNGLANAISYDSDLRPTATSGVVSLAFGYDLANRITGITNLFHASLSQSFTYDAMGHITTITSGVDNESFIYDPDGNRIRHIANGFTENSAYSASNNHLTQAAATTYGYDADGDVTTINGHVLYGYSGFSRLVGGNGGSYAIGAEDQRLRKTVAPNQTYFAPDKSGVLLAEDQAGTWLDYVWLSGRLVGVIRSGQVYSAHGDQTGRTLMLTDAARVPVWMATGLPFDRTITTNTFGEFNLGYPGQYYDAEDGFWYNGYRGYMPWLGRYSQSDPIGLAGGVNTYAYVGSNPITGIDPLGLRCTLLQRVGNAIGNFLNDHTQLELAFDAGDGLGASGAITITNSGIYGRFGVGVGIGFGVSLSAGGHIGHESGLDATVSATGGDGVGGTVQGTVSQGGPGATGSLGFGVEGGATATVGYSGKIANLPAALSHGHDSGCGCH